MADSAAFVGREHEDERMRSGEPLRSLEDRVAAPGYPSLLDAVRSGWHAGCDDKGHCLGCGLPSYRVADGAASGCEVCLAFLDWMGGTDDDDD